MDKNFAIKLIKDTFQDSFNKDRFICFVRNLFNTFDESKAFHAHGYVPDAFKSYIKTYERIGTYTDSKGKKIDVLIVYLQKKTTLDRGRTAQRNFIAYYLKSRDEKDAGLVAFVSPDNDDWRFSFVKMEYKLEKTEKGIIKAKEEFTPARRYSFLVGKNESSHTAQSCLIPILQDDEGDPTFEELENAFNVEKVTKEFFKEYHDLYFKIKEILDEIIEKDIKIKDDFKQKNISTVDFSKKLLGQIVFLYFLQKKGWFGVYRNKNWGDGDKQFLRHLFERAKEQNLNYFNKILEPLFYEALRLERPKDYYDQFNCRIPFLNGGLFDPINDYNWQDTDIDIPNQLFSNDDKTKQDDIGTGILDIFDRYNFTVKEDEPLEKEVAVDPEMLGKVFENLLEVRDRKLKGTYYTPREIVHYMCQESLINYLATELKCTLKQEDIEILIKYGETAVEHETEVVNRGKETKVYSYKLPNSIRSNAGLIDKKLMNIRICDPAVGSGAFLVGMMNEIIRARNTLTPFLEDEKDRTIYSFKRHAIQKCLYGVDIDSGAVEIAKLRLWLSLIVDEEDIKQIKPLPNLDYKIVCGNSLLGFPYTPQGLQKIEQLKDKLFDTTNPQNKKELRKIIDKKINILLSGTEKSLGYKVDFDFRIFFSEIFHEKKGFDIVIANPPYVNVNDMKKEAELYRNLYSTPFGSYDIYVPFFEKSIMILKEKGVLTFITSNKYFIADYAKKLRRFIIDNARILVLLDLADCRKVFEHAFVSPAVTILSKEKADKYKLKIGLLKDRNIYIIDKIRLSYLDIADLIQGPNDVFDIYSEDKNRTILRKLDVGSTTLGQIADVRTGIMGFEYWKMEPFIKESRQGGYIRIITNGQVDKYTFLFNKKINLYKKIFYNPYLNIKKAPVNENTKQLFYSKKIIIRGVAKKLSAQFDEGGLAVLVAVHTAIPKNLDYNSLYLLALLNSVLFNWYHITKFYTARIPMGSLKYPISFLKQLPVRIIKFVEQKPFINFVNKILVITKDDDYLQNETKRKKVKEYEQKINQMVYEIYNLTPAEIRIIEDGSIDKA